MQSTSKAALIRDTGERRWELALLLAGASGTETEMVGAGEHLLESLRASSMRPACTRGLDMPEQADGGRWKSAAPLCRTVDGVDEGVVDVELGLASWQHCRSTPGGSEPSRCMSGSSKLSGAGVSAGSACGDAACPYPLAVRVAEAECVAGGA